jgi:hypothetical protein
MRKTTISILLFSLSFLHAAVWAAEQIKPGLWEMTMKSDAMKNAPKIPPEQMEQMRKMGITIPKMQDGNIISKVCISKEMAERDQIPQADLKESGCQSKNYQRTGNNYTVDIVCNGPNLKGEGKVKGKFAGNESFSSTYDFKGASQGQPINQRHEHSGKWLGADCGNVKPLAETSRKK